MNPQEPSSDQFSGRMGLIFATIGAAIGTGNIWRFPRMVGANGTMLMGHIPLPDTSVGKIQYKAMLGTTNGAFPFTYPGVNEGGNYYELTIPYRASFGSSVLAVLMFLVIASFVWGGLGYPLRAMFDDERGVIGLPEDGG